MDTEYKEKVVDIAQTILLSAIVLVTAWCGYQAGLWSGVTTFNIAKSHDSALAASEEAQIAEKSRIIDAMVVANFTNAVIEKNQEIIDYYLRHLRPEFSQLLSEWLATDPLGNPDAPPHPLAMPEYEERIFPGYKENVEKLRQSAEILMKEGYRAKRISDAYVFRTVILSSVLFIGGVLPKIGPLNLRIFLLSVDYLVAIVTFIQLLFMPIATF